jgi:hypothetical protein
MCFETSQRASVKPLSCADGSAERVVLLLDIIAVSKISDTVCYPNIILLVCVGILHLDCKIKAEAPYGAFMVALQDREVAVARCFGSFIISFHDMEIG